MARGSIIVRETKAGVKRYAAVIRINGKQRWETFARKKDAEGYLDRNSTDVREGTYREIEPATFSEYIEHWRATHLIPENFKPSTYNSYSTIVDRHLIPEFGPRQLTGITPADINRLSAKLLQGNQQHNRKPLSPKTVENVLILLGKILAQARREHYLKQSPMNDVEKPAIEKKKKGRALRPGEIQEILKYCTGQLRLQFLTALLTGMRAGELFGLWWEEIDWDQNVIRIRRALYWRDGKYHRKPEGGAAEPWVYVDPKSKASIREIDLSPALRKELLELYLKSPKTGLVFRTKRGTPLRPGNITKRRFGHALKMAEAMRKAASQPRIGKVRWHDLRHTFGSVKIEQGENVYYVQRQMGHSSIQVTVDIYGHLLEARKPEAAAKTDALIFGK